MTLDRSIHRNILIKILKDIYTDGHLGPVLGFKGGTAAFLFYDLPRFSVDLDFDLLAPEEEENVFNRIHDIIKEFGTIKEVRNKRYNLFYLLSYDDKIEGAQNVKIEINKRDFGSQYEIRNYLGISMKVMRRDDMFAHKIVAMKERLGTTNRDIFDVWYFSKNDWPINKKIVEKRTETDFKMFIEKTIEELERMSSRHILSGLGELLDEKQKNWVKKNLINDTVFQLTLLIQDS